MYNGQVGQDLFVLKSTNYKHNGTFLEIGSNDPIYINNTYLLEKNYGWRGIMVEYDNKYLEGYNLHRKLSKSIINDATLIDYKKEFENFNMPNIIDYLQIDLEVTNNSTLTTLKILDTQIMNNYKFAVITFEHDFYAGDYFNTRAESREIFLRRGYVLVFPDVMNDGNQFEDWYVHPDLVDMNFINSIKSNSSFEYTDIVKILTC